MDWVGVQGHCLISLPSEPFLLPRSSPPDPLGSPKSLPWPRRPASIVSIWCYESRNFWSQVSPKAPPRPKNPVLGNSGLWAAPSTLLALPGGPVRKRLIFLPPAMQKILPALQIGLKLSWGIEKQIESSPTLPSAGIPTADPNCCYHTL